MVLGHEESRNVLERKVPDSEDRRERGQKGSRTETDEGMARLSGTGLHDRRYRQSKDVIKAS